MFCVCFLNSFAFAFSSVSSIYMNEIEEMYYLFTIIVIINII